MRKTPAFDIEEFLSTEGPGRKLMTFKAKQNFYLQGADAEVVYFLQKGRGKMTVVSKRGKQATITMLVAGDFFGEESMVIDNVEHRCATATALTVCYVMQITQDSMRQSLHDEHSFSDFFMQFTLKRGVRTQSDLIDQLFNSSERRLARALLMMADFKKPGVDDKARIDLHPITQESLAEMIGTTRARVSFFMNRFRRLGYIDYNGHITVHKSLMTTVLKDALPEDNAQRPPMFIMPHRAKKVAKKKAS